MLLIQGACKKLSNTASVLKDTKLIGTKLSEFTSSEESNSKGENDSEEESTLNDEKDLNDENKSEEEKESEEKIDKDINREIIQDFL